MQNLSEGNRKKREKNLHRTKYVNSLNRDCENFFDKRKTESESKRECKELYLNHKTSVHQ